MQRCRERCVPMCTAELRNFMISSMLNSHTHTHTPWGSQPCTEYSVGKQWYFSSCLTQTVTINTESWRTESITPGLLPRESGPLSIYSKPATGMVFILSTYLHFHMGIPNKMGILLFAFIFWLNSLVQQFELSSSKFCNLKQSSRKHCCSKVER